MAKRHITLSMVYEVLRRGRVPQPPEPDPRYATGLRYRMQYLCAGKDIVLVVYVEMPNPDLLVITAIDRDN
jgi:hypothetical protein